MIEFCHDRIKLGRNRNRRRTKISQVKHVTIKISMSQQTAQQVIRIREEISVATKEFPIATEISKDSKISCCDRVDRLKRKMFVATRKIMSRQTLEEEGHERLVTNRFGVVTQYILVVTRTRLLHKNYVATESKKELREQVATEDCMLRQRPTTNSFAIE